MAAVVVVVDVVVGLNDGSPGYDVETGRSTRFPGSPRMLVVPGTCRRLESVVAMGEVYVYCVVRTAVWLETRD